MTDVDATLEVEPEIVSGDPNVFETKDFDLELKLEDLDDEGQFVGYAAVFNNEDFNGDVIEPGAFKKTIRESKGRVPILWQHDVYNPIGITLELEEDKKGLLVRGQLVLATQRGAEAHALMKAEALRGLSIGYAAIKFLIDKTDGGWRRRLKEVRVGELSPVTFAANPLAVVTSLKSADIARLAGALRTLSTSDPEAVKALLDALDVKDEPEPGAAALAEEPDLSTLRALAPAITSVKRRAHQ